MLRIVDIFRKKVFLYSGVGAITFAWIIIGANWALNPWFNFWRDAYSDFGGSKACCPWLYNYGLIITGVMLILFSFGLLVFTRNKLETIGASYIIIAGIFLALIGIFPGGTYPHGCVAFWFFIQMDLAFIILGLGMALRKSRLGLIISVLSILEIPLAILVQLAVGWPSAAVIETYGIIIIDICVILSTIDFRQYGP